MSKRKTNDEFLKELNNINPNIYPLDKYIASSEKIRCRCKIDGHEWYAIPNNLLRGEGCPKCKYVGFAHARSKSHNNFVSQVLLLNNNIEIIGRYINNKTKVKCRCKIDEYEWEAQPSHLLRGSGCPVCSNKIIIHGINDVATTHPQYIKYFKNADDAMKYSAGSGKEINCVCPECGYEKRMTVSRLTGYGFSCRKCGDGISYPNKFIRAMLCQLLDKDVFYEWSEEWAKPYKYDNYFIINHNKYIIEADGGWHYKDNKLSGMSVEEAKRIDKIKEDLAIAHGISIIRIDCRESNKDYISKNIMASNLSKIFDLSIINWDLCDKNACKNIIKEVCMLYQHNSYNINDLSLLFHLHKRTIQSYLVKGNEFGWCKYTLRYVKRHISVFDMENHKLHDFESILKCVHNMSDIYNIKFKYSCVLNACNNAKPYNGFIFKLK